jgi:hypothetical protein
LWERYERRSVGQRFERERNERNERNDHIERNERERIKEYLDTVYEDVTLLTGHQNSYHTHISEHIWIGV